MPILTDQAPRPRSRWNRALWLLLLLVPLLPVGVLGYSFVRPVLATWGGTVVFVDGDLYAWDWSWIRTDQTFPAGAPVGRSGTVYVMDGSTMHYGQLVLGCPGWSISWFRGHRATAQERAKWGL